MAVRVVARGEAAKKKLRERGVTPGKIRTGSVSRSSSGKRTTRSASGDITKIEEPITTTEGKQAVKTTTFAQGPKSLSGGALLRGGPGQPTKTSFVDAQGRKLTDFEVAAIQAIGGGQSLAAGGERIVLPLTRQTVEDDDSEIGEKISRIVGVDTKFPVPLQETSPIVSPVKVPLLDPRPGAAREEKKKDKIGIIERLSGLQAKLEERATQQRTGSLDPAAFRMAAFGVSLLTGALRPIVKPIETFIETPLTIIQHPEDSLRSFREQFAARPVTTVGEIAGSTLTPTLIKTIVQPFKTAAVKVGAKFVPPEEVFSPQVTELGKQFPLAGSTEEIVGAFEATRTPGGDILAVTASPAKLKGTEAGLGRKGAVGLEDSGIFVTPKGEASPAFLRISGEADLTPGALSFNPLKGLFDQPTITEFTAKGIVKPPREVLETPGFEIVRKFQEEQLAGTGQLQVTKRALIGQGEAPAQKFKAPADFTEGEFNIKAGDIRREAGTSELEAVVPFKQEFAFTPETTIGKIKGFEKFTEFEGKPVAIREAELIVTKEGFVPETTVGPKARSITAEQISKEISVSDKSTFIRPPTTISISEFELSKLMGPISEVSITKGVSRVSEPSELIGKSRVSRPVSEFSRVPLPSEVIDVSKPSTPSRPSRPSRPVSSSRPVEEISTFVSEPPSTISRPVTPSRPVVPSRPFRTITPFFRPPIPPPVVSVRERLTDIRRGFFFPAAIVKGKLEKVGPAEPTREQAFSTAFAFAAETPSRSFGVIGRGDELEELEKLHFGFKRKKGERRLAVEPAIFAIDRPGEIIGISKKGQLAQRKKRFRI